MCLAGRARDALLSLGDSDKKKPVARFDRGDAAPKRPRGAACAKLEAERPMTTTRTLASLVSSSLPLDPSTALVDATSQALENRWGNGVTDGCTETWRQLWFGLDGVAAAYRFDEQHRLRAIQLSTSEGTALEAAMRCALGEPDEGGRSPGVASSLTYQVWRREGVHFC